MASEARILSADNATQLAAWCRGKLVTEHDALDHSSTSPGINLFAEGRVQRASMGDMIVRKSDGTFEIIKH